MSNKYGQLASTIAGIANTTATLVDTELTEVPQDVIDGFARVECEVRKLRLRSEVAMLRQNIGNAMADISRWKRVLEETYETLNSMEGQ